MSIWFLQINPVKVPQVDSNGAGDTFATAYMIALAQGHPDPGHAAAWTASRAVMAPQSCKPGCAGDALIGHRINGIRSNGSSSSESDSASNISQAPPDPQPPSQDADTKNWGSPDSSYHCRAWLLAGGAGWFRPWSLPEKLWADLMGLWPHMYAVLYDALAQPARKDDASEDAPGTQGTGLQQTQDNAVEEATGSCSATTSGEASRGRSRDADRGEGEMCEVRSWDDEPPSPSSYLHAAQRWAQRTSDRLQSMHQGLCGNSLQADRSWEGPTSSHGARYTDEGKEVSGSPTALQSLAGLYCGAVGGIRQAVLWVLQFGVSVAARIGLAIDEVARQQ